jgi:hypothetical protein
MISANDAFYFHVSSKRAASNTDSARFVAAIFKALCDIRDIFGSDLATAASKEKDGGKKKL